MKIDTSIMGVDISKISDLAQAAEEVGFDGLWSTEVKGDPFIPLALAAQNTTKIELGTAIALAFVRSPMNLAYSSWDLSKLSHGRFILGLGSQIRAHVERRYGAKWDSPVKKMRDVIGAVQTISNSWQNRTPLNYQGEYFKLDLMSPFFSPDPIEKDIPIFPIFLAAVNSKMCNLVGELCNGIHIHPLHSMKFIKESIIPNISEGAKKSSRNLEDIELSASSFVITGIDKDSYLKSKEFVKSQIAFYASTPSYSKVFEIHGWSDIASELLAMSKENKWTQMSSLINDDILSHFAIEGRPDQIADLALKRYENIVHRLTFYVPFDPTQNTMWWKKLISNFH